MGTPINIVTGMTIILVAFELLSSYMESLGSFAVVWCGVVWLCVCVCVCVCVCGGGGGGGVCQVCIKDIVLKRNNVICKPTIGQQKEGFEVTSWQVFIHNMDIKCLLVLLAYMAWGRNGIILYCQ